MRRTLYLCLLLALLSLRAEAQSFVYTNNDNVPNTVSAYAVDAAGVLSAVPGSPFATDGEGSNGGFFAAPRILTVGNFLYASNASSFDISGFSIDTQTGALTPVAGSPFPTGGYGGLGMGLAAVPATSKQYSHCLFAGESMSAVVVAFGVGAGGELTRVQRLFVGGFVNGMAAAPNGRYLTAVLSGYGQHGGVAMVGIDPTTCGLALAEGAPFPVRPDGMPAGGGAGVDINCGSNLMFISEAVPMGETVIVNVYTIDAETIAPTAIPGSPFQPGGGLNSNVPRLSPDGSLLFVSNQGGPTITVFTVGEGGTLTRVGAFLVGGSMANPSGMATDQAGEFLFVAGSNFAPVNQAHVRVFRVNPGGSLTQVGDPVMTGEPPGLLSLTAFPPRQCPAAKK